MYVRITSRGVTRLERIARQRPSYWLMLTLAHLLMLFAACSKDSGGSPTPTPTPTPDPEPTPTEVPKGNYGVFIGGVELTYDNYQNISAPTFPIVKKGKVSYNPVKRRLTLDGATLENTTAQAAIFQPESSTEKLTIALRNTSQLSSKGNAIELKTAPLLILGEGSLSIDVPSDRFAIRLQKRLSFSNCTFSANAPIVTEKIVVDETNLHLTATEGTSVLRIFTEEDFYSSFVLLNCKFKLQLSLFLGPKRIDNLYWILLDNYNKVVSELKVVKTLTND